MRQLVAAIANAMRVSSREWLFRFTEECESLSAYPSAAPGSVTRRLPRGDRGFRRAHDALVFRTVLSLLFVVSACGGPAPAQWRVRTSTPPPAFGHLTGVVKDDHGIDACTWLVDGDDGRIYQPRQALPASIQKDGLRIAADVTICNDCASTCLTGWIADFANVQTVK